MSSYLRPTVKTPVFADADGDMIGYGHRWGVESPPSDSYSIVNDPERFAPLQVIADAVVDHLRAVYDVDVSTDPADAIGIRHDPRHALRTITLIPRDADAAPVTVVHTDFPGVIISAGVLLHLPYPTCGCDACDETWDGLASDLESTLFDIAAGLYQEYAAAGSPPIVGYQFGSPDADVYSASRGPADDREVESLRSRSITPPWSRQWRPWPYRPPAPARSSD